MSSRSNGGNKAGVTITFITDSYLCYLEKTTSTFSGVNRGPNYHIIYGVQGLRTNFDDKYNIILWF